MKKVYHKEEGDIGIATLILFIAIIIVAAIASSLIIYVGVTLREQGEEVAKEATEQITSSLRILNILGDRDTDGKPANIISVRAPIQHDSTPPVGGVIENVSLYSTNPLGVLIRWKSAVDYESGMCCEKIYRVSGDDTTLKYVLSNINYVKEMGTLVANITGNFSSDRSYVDYSVDSGQTYGYAIIGYDHAGNALLYEENDNIITVSTGTKDTTPPSGSVNNIKSAGVGVLITWTASDSGSGIAKQIVYRSRSEISASNINNATVVAVLNGTARSYMDYPPSNGTWYYAVEGIDRAGNTAIYTSNVDSIDVSMVDTGKPRDIGGMHAYTGDYWIDISWAPSRDNESGIAGYYVYRSLNYEALTSNAILSSRPYAFVNTTHFKDYVYQPYQVYYYLVIPVDRAGNVGDIIYPQSTIQILELKVALGPGSQPVDFNDVIVELTDGHVEASLQLNSSGFGVNYSDGKHFSVGVVRDPSGEFRSNYILGDGGVVIIYINARKVGLSLEPQTVLTMKILPGNGIPIYVKVIIPSIMLNRFVQIY